MTLRSPPSRAVLCASLAMSLLLGSAAVLTYRQPAGAPDRGAPAGDDAAIAQVREAAEHITAAAGLDGATGGYRFLSCAADGPPYQAVVYLTFIVPERNWARYLSGVANAMRSHGWVRAPTAAEHFGHKLTRDGVTAIVHRNVENPGFATLRLYGPCRNHNDHRTDAPVWTDIGIPSRSGR
ncbi:Putative lipoprotein LppJ [Mycolicibacterium hassiacum DSM 44199]|uniref:hypothetical protein n=1 Tax=Mycolicibacterium hassiacum TaxID=46351 RepID=UPI00036AEEC9|nr:hypothetical protein [Mycolicibacterium hassiacum]MDA4088632.1 hypothetical protein [Mycolicibacterium hassiacum DSM 44199]VCT90172.1 Putative lipoprotein LppJ [Mycolicibacterium hassiacum DSM 44199]